MQQIVNLLKLKTRTEIQRNENVKILKAIDDNNRTIFRSKQKNVTVSKVFPFFLYQINSKNFTLLIRDE